MLWEPRNQIGVVLMNPTTLIEENLYITLLSAVLQEQGANNSQSKYKYLLSTHTENIATCS